MALVQTAAPAAAFPPSADSILQHMDFQAAFVDVRPSSAVDSQHATGNVLYTPGHNRAASVSSIGHSRKRHPQHNDSVSSVPVIDPELAVFKNTNTSDDHDGGNVKQLNITPHPETCNDQQNSPTPVQILHQNQVLCEPPLDSTSIPFKKGLKARLRRALSFSATSSVRPGIPDTLYSLPQNSSTDNISIASTASSASVVLRKMGKGLRRSSKNLAGIFRPKIVEQEPGCQNYSPLPVLPEICRVTVEVENGLVNPPESRRKSVFIERPMDRVPSKESINSFKTKGILKPSPNTSPVLQQNEFITSNVEKRNITFSPRITIHDTWPSAEYDRRGDIATCNRLTPALAQRIKEELNAYKMEEMQVAETSRVYTHFF